MVVATSSVAGRAHRHKQKASQDAIAAIATSDVAVAVVCDGCSAGAHSEVGAGVAARLVAAACARRARAGLALPALPAAVLADLHESLVVLARALTVDEADVRDVVAAHLLFTVQAAVVRGDEAVVFGVGDGVVVVDDRVIVIDDGPAPDYPAYALPALAGAVPHPPRLRVHHAGAFQRAVAVCTDGAAEIDPAAATHLGDGAPLGALLDLVSRGPLAARFARNASLLQKRMNAWVTAAGGPVDDCSIAVIRRPSAEDPCA